MEIMFIADPVDAVEVRGVEVDEREGLTDRIHDRRGMMQRRGSS